jgi:hypothetical protein
MKRQLNQHFGHNQKNLTFRPGLKSTQRLLLYVLISFVNIVLDVDATVAGEHIGLSASSLILGPRAIMLFVSEY